MNLGLFNRMNLKDNQENKGMYSEWTSLSLPSQEGAQEGQESVLEKFDQPISKEITLGLVRQLASNLGIAQAPQPSILKTDKDVQWSMEVICFGLSLPLAEHDAIKDCVNIYCEWLTSLLPEPKVCVPKPIVDDPNIYSRKIISHLHHLFVPRRGEGPDIIHRQAVLCHRVLRTLQQIAHNSKTLEKETWEALLLFLLTINDILLSPPTVKDDVADQLCERVLSVLFEIWLVACAQCFPSPPLWKTLRECCMNWRHRVALIEQWNRINLALTSKVLVFMYGPDFPELKIGEEDLIPKGMSNDCIAQSWFRFLKTIGNPVSLTKPEVISQTQKFLQYAISRESVVDPCQHPCLKILPTIFLKAIKGISGQVDAYLGIAPSGIWWDTMVMGTSTEKSRAEAPPPPLPAHSPTPPTQRRLAKSFSVSQSSSSKGIPKASLIGLTTSRSSVVSTPSTSSGPSSTSSTTSITSFGPDSKEQLASGRPKCNTILHLFGEWLFDAAFIGSEITSSHSRQSSGSFKRPNSIVLESGKSSLTYSQPSSLSDADIPPGLTIDKYESGKADALGTLCRIFCSKKTGEEILPVYLARFYVALSQALKAAIRSKECGECLIAILMNSQSIFSLDIDGVRTLIPFYLSALELVLPDRDVKITSNITKTELRRAAIHILLSLLVLPLHFQNCPIKELHHNSGLSDKPITFLSLKLKLMNLLMNALQVEYDPHNTHMLLGGLFLCVQDSTLFENADDTRQSQPAEASGSSGNLLSSASDTASTTSMASSSGRAATPDKRPRSDAPLDSAHALFVRATYLVCHRLISSWKTDLNVSLAALELLSGLARIHVKESDPLECKRAVKWLCDYIGFQCSRPPPAHSKDLHSTIVAAFYCCSIWLLEHPYLLKDEGCLMTVLEVCELGITGSKSVGKPSEKVKMKEEKELKPVSMRVRDAAENLQTLIMEQVNYFPDPCGPESISSLLNEVSLLRYCASWSEKYKDISNAVEKYRYFVTKGTVMLALLEEPLGNNQDPQPTITLLIRRPFGRHAWTLQLRHLPRHKSGIKSYTTTNACRPVAMKDIPVKPKVKQKYFPDSVERVPKVKMDKSIPTINELLESNPKLKEDSKLISQLINKQAKIEKELFKQTKKPAECTPPPPVQEFQTSRLFLSHFGLLGLSDDEDDPETSTKLISLDSSMADFCKDLQILDAMSPRTCDTAHIFYVRSQQTHAQDIVKNMSNPNDLSPFFFEFIHTLGWPVNVDKHPGWTGHRSTSWRIGLEFNEESRTEKQQKYDGLNYVLYWADAVSEIAFVMPSSLRPDESQRFNTSTLSASSDSSWSDEKSKRTQSLDGDKQDKQPIPPKRANKSHIQSELTTKIMIVWLESYEDHLTFPIEDLLETMNTGFEKTAVKPSDVVVIYLHFLATGLFRVHLTGPKGKVGIASPLVDGMIVSRRSLGTLVRHTALNMGRRKRLDFDNYQPPHARRRIKIQEITQKYKRIMSKPELLTYLFSRT